MSVAAPVDGMVESFGADVGQDVFEGQLIAHIHNSKNDSQLEAATAETERMQNRIHELEAALVAGRLEASRAGAEATLSKSDFDRITKVYQRQQMLIREGATPRLTFEKAEREFNSAKDDFETKQQLASQAGDRLESLNRELDAARRMLDERDQFLERAKAEAAAGAVRSPVDGMVLSRRGAPGDEVNRSMQDLFRIAVTLSALEIAVQPEPAAVPRIKVGQPVVIQAAEAPDSIAGTVREIKDGRVIVDFISPTPAIRPGVTAQVHIKLG